MKIVILHNKISEMALPDELDVLNQIAAVSEALKELGHEYETYSVDLNLQKTYDELTLIKPELVFNLVESINSKGSLVHLAPSLLGSMSIPYSGSPADAIFVTSNKLLAKEAIHRAGLPTAPWITLDDIRGGKRPKTGLHIIKSVWEHASIGLDEKSLVISDRTRLKQAICSKRSKIGGDWFAEQYIDGREFNISIIANRKEPLVLNPAEIRFVEYGSEKPKLVDYKAKWDEDSFEYQNTIRCFDFKEDDQQLLEKLSSITRDCWELFHLKGYARVDFRVDSNGCPWILEVNTNPCLSKDAGFAAALKESGISYTEAIRRILNDLSI
jgi:D-alanine-D-alanine ligase